MRIKPNLKWLNYKDYKRKVSPEEMLSELRQRYKSVTLERTAPFMWDRMPNKRCKKALGFTGVWVPKFEWNKLQWKFGKMLGNNSINSLKKTRQVLDDNNA